MYLHKNSALECLARPQLTHNILTTHYSCIAYLLLGTAYSAGPTYGAQCLAALWSLLHWRVDLLEDALLDAHGLLLALLLQLLRSQPEHACRLILLFLLLNSLVSLYNTAKSISLGPADLPRQNQQVAQMALQIISLIAISTVMRGLLHRPVRT